MGAASLDRRVIQSSKGDRQIELARLGDCAYCGQAVDSRNVVLVSQFRPSSATVTSVPSYNP
jgi:hypothetical protein